MSMQPPQGVNFWRDTFAPTSILAASVAKTTLNGGIDYNMSEKAGALISVTPQVTITAAFTAAESLMVRAIIESTSLTGLIPKEWVASYGLGGLGTFTYAQYPILQAYEINAALKHANTPITFSGQNQIANTVAPEMTMMLSLTNGGPLGMEQFYWAPPNETNTGTAAGEVAGNDLVINQGATINSLYTVLTPGVTTASESTSGRGQLASSNFEGGVPTPQRWLAQPIASALGSHISVSTQDRWEKVNLPIANTFTGTTSLLLDEALTATGNFIVGSRYYKRNPGQNR